MENAKTKGDSRVVRKLYVLLGAFVGVVLVAWIVLMVFIFGDDKSAKKDGDAENAQKYEQVFRIVAEYSVTNKGERRQTYSAKYDEGGRVLSEISYGLSGKPAMTYTYEYDSCGREVLYEHLSYNKTQEAPVSTERNTHKYGDDGRILEDAYYDSVGGTDRVITYYYDDDGVLTREVCTYKNWTSGPHYEYTYYPNGEVKESLIGVVRKTYDEEGRLLKGENVNTGKVLLEMTYDPDGKLLRRVMSSDGAYEVPGTDITEYSYDKNGEIVREYTCRNGEPISELVYSNGEEDICCDEYDLTREAGKTLTKRTVKRRDGTYEEEITYFFDNTTTTERRRRDESGRMISNVRLGRKGNYIKYEEYEYAVAATGGEIKRTIYRDENGEVKYRTEEERLPDGTQIRELYYNPDDSYRNNGPEGNYGYYFELDENNNPVRKYEMINGEAILVKEIEYISFVIPKESSDEKDKGK